MVDTDKVVSQKKSLATLAWPWALVSLVLGLVIGAGVLYFWQAPILTQKERDTAALTKKIAQEELDPASSTSQNDARPMQGHGSGVNKQTLEQNPRPSEPKNEELSDRQILEIKILDYHRASSVAQYWAPRVVITDDNLRATTSAIPVRYDASNGYYVPGMGGMSLFWHKVQGGWKQVGHCSESGCDMKLGYDEKSFPRG